MSKDIIKLGPRLTGIASYVPQGSMLGDIGTDHAYLPVYLTQTGVIRSAVGVDIHQGPYESARQTVEQYALAGSIDIRLGNGLTPLKPGEVDTLSIAGMGGTTILEILQSKPAVLEGVFTLILQPQGAEARVRTELIALGWRLKDECLLEEDKRIYSILVFTRFEGLGAEEIDSIIEDIRDSFQVYTEKEESLAKILDKKTVEEFISKWVWTLGPILLQKKDNYLQKIVTENIINLDNIVQEMSKTARTEIQTKSKMVLKERKMLEVMYRWLFQ